MKFILSIAGIFALVAAQAPPGAQNLPQCGTSVMVSAITAMKCGFLDSSCICSKPDFKAALKQVGQKCTTPEDKTAYQNFANKQCAGQPGFPITSL